MIRLYPATLRGHVAANARRHAEKMLIEIRRHVELGAPVPELLCADVAVLLAVERNNGGEGAARA